MCIGPLVCTASTVVVCLKTCGSGFLSPLLGMMKKTACNEIMDLKVFLVYQVRLQILILVDVSCCLQAGKDSRLDKVKSQPGTFLLYWTVQVGLLSPLDTNEQSLIGKLLDTCSYVRFTITQTRSCWQYFFNWAIWFICSSLDTRILATHCKPPICCSSIPLSVAVWSDGAGSVGVCGVPAHAPPQLLPCCPPPPPHVPGGGALGTGLRSRSNR
jgi:hypothetical protein